MTPRHLPTFGWPLLFLLIVALSGCMRSPVSGARRAAQEASSRHHIKQLTLALVQFHEDQQRWPDQLTEVLPFLNGDNSVLNNPITGEEFGYDYVKPTIAPEDPQSSTTVVIYQLRDGKRDTELEVGYLDGSVKTL